MRALYADTSALARAYLEDERDHELLRRALLERGDLVVTSELARVELASAVTSAARGRRIAHPRELLSRIGADQHSGAVTLLNLRPEPVLARAFQLVQAHRLRTLDALHLAVALEDAAPLVAPERLVFVTRDVQQAEAAAGLGLRVE